MLSRPYISVSLVHSIMAGLSSLMQFTSNILKKWKIFLILSSFFVCINWYVSLDAGPFMLGLGPHLFHMIPHFTWEPFKVLFFTTSMWILSTGYVVCDNIHCFCWFNMHLSVSVLGEDTVHLSVTSPGERTTCTYQWPALGRGQHAPISDQPWGHHAPISDQPWGHHTPISDQPWGHHTPISVQPWGHHTPISDQPWGHHAPISDQPWGEDTMHLSVTSPGERTPCIYQWPALGRGQHAPISDKPWGHHAPISDQPWGEDTKITVKTLCFPIWNTITILLEEAII